MSCVLVLIFAEYMYVKLCENTYLSLMEAMQSVRRGIRRNTNRIMFHRKNLSVPIGMSVCMYTYKHACYHILCYSSADIMMCQ